MINVKDLVTKELPTYGIRVIYNLIIAFYRLRMFDPLLWAGLHKECNKMLHLIKSPAFGKIFIILHEEECKAPKEMLDRMTEIMPNHLNHFSQNVIVKVFEILIKKKALNHYLFEDHFYRIFIKRKHWFGIENYPKIIQLLIEIKHFVRK